MTTAAAAARPRAGAAGQPVPARRDRPRRRHELRRGVRRRRRHDCCACSTSAAPRPRSRCWTTTPASGTVSCPGSGPGRPTATAPPVPTIRPRGLRCNPAKLLLDPYARAISGDGERSGPRCSATRPTTRTRRARSTRPGTCRAAWSSTARSAGPTAPGPGARYADTIIYEVHVKGFTMRHPGVPAELRGTYAGLGHEAAIAHLVDLGVTAVELLPVHQNVPEAFLLAARADQLLGLQHDRLLRAARRLLRRGAGRAARRPGRRVQGHGRRAARGRARGAARRGVQPHRRGRPARARRCASAAWTTRPTTGWTPATRAVTSTPPAAATRSTPATRVTLQLIMDSLRYWVTEMHVDGFRFDLAPTLARQDGGFDQRSAFFDLVSQDPVVSRVKLIAEPWDVGQMDSYDLGRLPAAVAGVERQVPRQHARLLAQPPGRPRRVRHPVRRVVGPVRRRGRRRPTASVNLITVHDGFTLRDLVSYNDKHNEANGESNRDGTDDNRSWNCGVEGPTDDPDVLALRARQSRAMLTTLLLSFGVPMLLGGDELRPHPAGQQQRLLPGQRDHLVRLVRRRQGAAGVHPAADRLPQGAPGVPPPPVPGRGGGRRARLVHPGRHRDDRRPTGPTPAPWRLAIYLDGSDATRPGRRRHADGRRRLPASWSTPGGSRSTSPSRPPVTG